MNTFIRIGTATILAIGLVACGGGGGGGSGSKTKAVSVSGTVRAPVTAALKTTPLAGVRYKEAAACPAASFTVVVEDQTTCTQPLGNGGLQEYNITVDVNESNSELVLNFRKDGFAPFAQSISIDESGSVIAPLLDAREYDTVKNADTSATAATVTAENGNDADESVDATLVLPVGTAKTAVNVSVLVVDPANKKDYKLLPGEQKDKANQPLEQIAAVEVTISDANTGESLQPEKNIDLTLALPPQAVRNVRALIAGGLSRDDLRIAWRSYDEDSNRWVDEDADPSIPGIQGAAVEFDDNEEDPAPVNLRALLSHLSWYAAGHIILPANQGCMEVAVTENGQPLPDAVVRLSGENFAFSDLAVTNASGKARLNSLILNKPQSDNRTVTLEVQIDGQTVAQEVNVNAPATGGNNADIVSACDTGPSIAVVRDGTLTGQVVRGAKDVAAPNTVVFLEGTEEPFDDVAVARTNASGQYQFTLPVPTAGYAYNVYAGSVSGSGTLTGTSGTAPQLDIGNTAPTNAEISAGNNTTIPAGNIVLTGAFDDADGEDVTFIWTESAGTLGAASGAQITWTAPNTPSGSATVTLKVNDGEADSNTASITLTWAEQNVAPTASISGHSGTVLNGSQVVLNANASDANSGDTLSYSWSATTGSFNGSTTAATANYIAPSTGDGTDTVTVTVSDGSLSGTNSATITYGNQAPVISSISGSSSQTVGTQQAFTANATDADSGPAPLSYSWSATGGTITSGQTSSVVSWQAPQTEGDYDLTVVVSDGLKQSTATITVTVSSAPVSSIPGDYHLLSVWHDVSNRGPNETRQELGIYQALLNLTANSDLLSLSQLSGQETRISLGTDNNTSAWASGDFDEEGAGTEPLASKTAVVDGVIYFNFEPRLETEGNGEFEFEFDQDLWAVPTTSGQYVGGFPWIDIETDTLLGHEGGFTSNANEINRSVPEPNMTFLSKALSGFDKNLINGDYGMVVYVQQYANDGTRETAAQIHPINFVNGTGTANTTFHQANIARDLNGNYPAQTNFSYTQAFGAGDTRTVTLNATTNGTLSGTDEFDVVDGQSSKNVRGFAGSNGDVLTLILDDVNATIDPTIRELAYGQAIKLGSGVTTAQLQGKQYMLHFMGAGLSGTKESEWEMVSGLVMSLDANGVATFICNEAMRSVENNMTEGPNSQVGGEYDRDATSCDDTEVLSGTWAVGSNGLFTGTQSGADQATPNTIDWTINFRGYVSADQKHIVFAEHEDLSSGQTRWISLVVGGEVPSDSVNNVAPSITATSNNASVAHGETVNVTVTTDDADNDTVTVTPYASAGSFVNNTDWKAPNHGRGSTILYYLAEDGKEQTLAELVVTWGAKNANGATDIQHQQAARDYYELVIEPEAVLETFFDDADPGDDPGGCEDGGASTRSVVDSNQDPKAGNADLAVGDVVTWTYTNCKDSDFNAPVDDFELVNGTITFTITGIDENVSESDLEPYIGKYRIRDGIDVTETGKYQWTKETDFSVQHGPNAANYDSAVTSSEITHFLFAGKDSNNNHQTALEMWIAEPGENSFYTFPYTVEDDMYGDPTGRFELTAIGSKQFAAMLIDHQRNKVMVGLSYRVEGFDEPVAGNKQLDVKVETVSPQWMDGFQDFNNGGEIEVNDMETEVTRLTFTQHPVIGSANGRVVELDRQQGALVQSAESLLYIIETNGVGSVDYDAFAVTTDDAIRNGNYGSVSGSNGSAQPTPPAP